ncbi:hypothetical protein PRZ48_001932 [Zasmidium cellare]|uniref:NACHT domain-containing protein n=1 Tax=Zasmidium cellare TaxID=395010 RepID=A0ABR0F2L3_ZASCE|nr:hypothetical protein PRZ48_001932 [Zasmidium cellare]
MADYTRPHSRDGFKIAVLCALPREANAVMALLDEEWEDAAQLYGKSGADDNSYTFGLLGGKPVVLAYASMGKVAAANVSKDLTASFRSINLLLVVGVCGAAPRDPEKDVEINLGDIIISTQVIQGDFGRQHEHHFERKTEVEDTLGRASREIRHFVTKLSTMHTEARLIQRTNQYFANVLQHPVHRKRFHNPVDVANALIQLQDVPNVNLHFGRVISTDSVIKSASYRDDAVSREKAVAFEMESAGTWENAPTILVKGVCDYADENKNKDWQDFAALSAASCAKAIAQEWVVRVESRAEPVNTVGASNTTAMYSDLLEALQPVNPDDNLMDAKSRTRGVIATATTCEWVLRSTEFKTWSTARHSSILVISGEPGIGKTTMATIIVDRLREETRSSRSTVAYFFVNNRVERQRTALAILRSLMYQVLASSPHLCEPVQQQFRIFREGLFEKFTTVWPLFRQMLLAPNFGEVYFIVDAFDECQEQNREELIGGLCSLLALPYSDGHNPNKVKLLVLTRPNLIKELLGNHIGKECHIQVGRQEIKDDLEFYIEKEVEKLVAKRQWSDATHEAIQNMLRSRHDGTFLWVGLVVKRIGQSKVRERDVLRILGQFPSGLTEVYVRILREINETDSDYAPDVLKYVLACRSLSHDLDLTAMAILLHFREKAKPGTRALPTLREIQCLESAVEACGMLLQVGRHLEFLHQTVKDFLTGDNLPDDLVSYTTSDAKAMASYRSTLQRYLEAKEFEELAELDRRILESIARSNDDAMEQYKTCSDRFAHIKAWHLTPWSFAISEIFIRSSMEWPTLAFLLFRRVNHHYDLDTRPYVPAILKFMAEQDQMATLLLHLWILVLAPTWATSSRVEEILPSIIGFAIRRGYPLVVDSLFAFVVEGSHIINLCDFFAWSLIKVREGDMNRAFLCFSRQHQAELATRGISRAQSLRLTIFSANVSFTKELVGVDSVGSEATGLESRLTDALLKSQWIVLRIEDKFKMYGARYTKELMLPPDESLRDSLKAQGLHDSRPLEPHEKPPLQDLLKQFKTPLLLRFRRGPEGFRLLGLTTESIGSANLATTDTLDGDKWSVNFWTPLDYALDLWRAIRDDRRREIVSFLAEQMRDAQLLNNAEYRGVVQELEVGKEEPVVDLSLDRTINADFDARHLDSEPTGPSSAKKLIFRTKRAANRALGRGEDWEYVPSARKTKKASRKEFKAMVAAIESDPGPDSRLPRVYW